jgi:hypothetical protein
LNTTTTFTACSEGSAFCSNADTAQLCSIEGGRFRSITCDAGCDPTTGRCIPPEGQRCEDAPQITRSSENPDETISKELNLAQFTDAYELPTTSCLGANHTLTTGPEKAYAVVLPADTSVEATVNFENDVRGSLYLVDNCDEPGDTCRSGASDSDMNVSVEYCPSSGLPDRYTCSSGCTDGRCDNTNSEFCYDAEDITSQASMSGGLTRTINWSNFSDDFDWEPHCETGGVDQDEIAGQDAVYKVDLAADEYLTASLDPQESSDESTLMILNGCTNIHDEEACEYGNHSYSGPASLTYNPETAQTVYLVATNDNDTSSGSSDTFELSANVKEQVCTRNSRNCNGQVVEYCGTGGISQFTYSCPSSCSNGMCDTRNNEFCYTAENITTQAASGGFNRTASWSNFSNNIDSPGSFECTFLGEDDAQGEDAFYRVDLQQGETLDVSISSSGTKAYIAAVSNCANYADTCVAGDLKFGFGSSASFSHTAQQDRTLFIIADNAENSGHGSTFTLDVTIK